MSGWRAILERLLLVLSGTLLVGHLSLELWASAEGMPEALREPLRASSLALYDRHGRLLRELSWKAGRVSAEVSLDQVSPDLVRALIATEDRRFYEHDGVDVLAMARALVDAARAGRIVSGASTLTQQLVKTSTRRPRTLWGKLREVVVARRIEREFDKPRILTEYLNRVEFGPNLRGVEAASESYFGKPARDLDLAESATLVAIVKGPSWYDPRRHSERTTARRDHVLRQMQLKGAAAPERVRAALQEPMRVQPALAGRAPLHWAFALASGELSPGLEPSRVRRLHTTLDAALQQEVETTVRSLRSRLGEIGASAASVLVIENRSGDVLAYVGSPDYLDAAALGSNDGTRALRQPGSALKPFVYAAAIERLGYDAATVLPDLALELETPNGRYRPQNYDGREHGPVRLRVALGSSLNLPALTVARRVGPSHVLELLRRFGFRSLTRDASHYGAGIALGDGEVRLSELAQAYAALARGGTLARLRYVRFAELSGGARVWFDASTQERVIDERTARLVSDILADDAARSPAFGRASALDFDFAAAAKTGTSKGFRDNWAVASSSEITVAVWVGNFDGRPLVRSSGVSGAGPLLNSILNSAMRSRSQGARRAIAEDSAFEPVRICALSGLRAGAACSAQLTEYFLRERAPQRTCDWHQSRAGEIFEAYPELYRNWAARAGRPLLSSSLDAAARPGSTAEPRIVWPRSGARFVLNPSGKSEIVIVGAGLDPSRPAELRADGKRVHSAEFPFEFVWPLRLGDHELSIEQGTSSLPVRVSVAR
ncbi:MAG TPA: penicillin-binding protein 1C [Polyangiaceae bacterium]|nr:penicillin-binding protein 1C [Polyangiaceae bacterium]